MNLKHILKTIFRHFSMFNKSKVYKCPDIFLFAHLITTRSKYLRTHIKYFIHFKIDTFYIILHVHIAGVLNRYMIIISMFILSAKPYWKV